MADTLHDALHDECEKLAQYKRDGFESLPLAAVTRALSRVADAARPFTDWLCPANRNRKRHQVVTAGTKKGPRHHP